MNNEFIELLHLQPGELAIAEVLKDLETYEKTGTSPMVEKWKAGELAIKKGKEK